MADDLVPLSVERSRELDKSSAEVWKTIGNFDGVSWISKEASCSIENKMAANQVGAIRVIELAPGKIVRETLLDYDSSKHFYTYDVIEYGEEFPESMSVFPGKVIGYKASLSVQTLADDKCKVSWRADWKTDAANKEKFLEIIKKLFSCLQNL